jgi:lipid II:glycine glycyltransferase (peptidoglycan interpeptide bridge formation enzyme)
VISIRNIEEAQKETCEKFISEYGFQSFLQSWAWGNFQKSLAREIFRLGIYEDESLVGLSLLVLEKSKFATFLYCPAGPIFRYWKIETFSEWASFATQLGREKKASFIRIDPRKLPDQSEEILKKSKFIEAAEYVQPKCTGVIDLTKTEEELRGKMSPSTRNNVNAASRKGVVVREGRAEEIATFLDLLHQTAKRKGLVLPSEKSYHEAQFEALNKEGLMKLYIAETKSDVLGASLVNFYAGTAYYMHAANSLSQPHLRASYPLVWHTILEAKKEGLKTFDFWGVAATDNPKDPWAGVTSFKFSFGANRVCFPPPYDLPLKPTYTLIRFTEHLRKPLRKILRFRQ